MRVKLRFNSCCCSIQINKKDKTEPKTLTITPSEKTHFRVILSREAMEEESRGGERSRDPVCNIIKPEPRTIKVDPCSHKPPEASCHSTNFPPPDPANLASSSFTSEPCPTNSDLGTVRKTRWTSSPPSRRDSGSAAGGGGAREAVCPDSRATSKPDSPSKRRSKDDFLPSSLGL